MEDILMRKNVGEGGRGEEIRLMFPPKKKKKLSDTLHLKKKNVTVKKEN